MNKKINFNTTHFTDDQIASFYLNYRECAEKFGCFYMGYIFEDLNKQSRIGFTTNPDWQSQYIGNHLVDSCHLWNAVLNYFYQSDNPYFILQWKMIHPATPLQKDIILYREELGIGQDGISFCSKHNNTREFLYFAPEKSETKFMQYVNSNLDVIKSVGKNFRRAAKNIIK